MRMHPNPSKLFRPEASIHLLVKEIGYGAVVESHMRPGADLLDELDILDQQ